MPTQTLSYESVWQQLGGTQNEALKVSRDVFYKRIVSEKTAIVTVDDTHNNAMFHFCLDKVFKNEQLMFDEPPEFLYSVVIFGEIPESFVRAYQLKTRANNYDDGRGDRGGDACKDLEMLTRDFYYIHNNEAIRILNAKILVFYIPGDMEWFEFLKE